MKKINFCAIFLLCFSFFVLMFLGSVDEISEIDAVTAVYVDYKDEKINVLCEILTPAKETSIQNESKFVKGIGFTLSEAFADAAQKSEKKLYTDTIQFFAVSQDIYDSDAVRQYFISNDVNMRAAILPTKTDAFSLAEDGKKRGDIYLKKVQDYCYINKTPVPEITEYLKNESPVLLNEYGSPERRS